MNDHRLCGLLGKIWLFCIGHVTAWHSAQLEVSRAVLGHGLALNGRKLKEHVLELLLLDAGLSELVGTKICLILQVQVLHVR